MAKRKSIDEIAGEPAVPAAEAAPVKAELPIVESPSISPAGPLIEPELEPAPAPILALDTPSLETPAAEPAIEAPADAAASPVSSFLPRLVIRPRHKRYALLAASVAVAAALGTIVGAVATAGLQPAPRVDLAVAERQSMQQTVDKLAKEVVTLKSGLDAANKAARSQIAKIDEKFTEKFDRAAAEEVTGSISAPQTVPVVAPLPRPAPRIAAVESRPQVVQDWSIRETRNGYVYVQGHGDVYQVVPGAPLPGLGPVQSIKQQDGRWVVTTPRGIIVSMRDRRYFE